MQNQGTGSIISGSNPTAPQPMGYQPMPGQPMPGQPAGGINPVATVPVPDAPKQRSHLIETIILIVVSILAVTFIGLFVWMYIQYDDIKTNFDGKVEEEKAIAVEQKATELQEEFTAREKLPYTDFTGPEEYGSLHFQYPKTWSVYYAKTSSDGGDYQVYMNPGGVLPVGTSTINALRVSIVNKTFDNVTKTYEGNIRSGKLKVSTPQLNGETVNRYEGELPVGRLHGIAVVFKLRDKTAIIQTDAELFRNDFDTLLGTVTYSQ